MGHELLPHFGPEDPDPCPSHLTPERPLPGNPLIWFATRGAIPTIYFPAAFGILLLFYVRASYTPGGAPPGPPKRGDPVPVAYHVLGGALMNAAVAAIATPLDIGLSMIFALWGTAGVLAAPLALQGADKPRNVAAILVVIALPVYAACELGIGVCGALISRMSLTGAAGAPRAASQGQDLFSLAAPRAPAAPRLTHTNPPPPPSPPPATPSGHVFLGLGDAVAGLLVGVGATSILGGVVTPLLTAALGRHARRVAGALLLFAIGIATLGGCCVRARLPPACAREHLSPRSPGHKPTRALTA
jgi:hypothetical protein